MRSVALLVFALGCSGSAERGLFEPVAQGGSAGAGGTAGAAAGTAGQSGAVSTSGGSGSSVGGSVGSAGVGGQAGAFGVGGSLASGGTGSGGTAQAGSAGSAGSGFAGTGGSAGGSGETLLWSGVFEQDVDAFANPHPVGNVTHEIFLRSCNAVCGDPEGLTGGDVDNGVTGSEEFAPTEFADTLQLFLTRASCLDDANNCSIRIRVTHHYTEFPNSPAVATKPFPLPENASSWQATRLVRVLRANSFFPEENPDWYHWDVEWQLWGSE